MFAIQKRNNVKITGHKNGPTILYANGFGCHQGMWDLVIPHFAETHRQIVFDYVGSGGSDITAFDAKRYQGLTGYRDDIIEICDELGLKEDVLFVAHSVSCSIGWLTSLLRPKLFSRQVSIGPSPCFINHPSDNYMGGFEASDLNDLLEMMNQNYLGWAEYLAPVISGHDINMPVSSKLKESFCSTDPRAARLFARATFFADNRADLAKVTTPNLLLQHANDSLVPVEIGHYLHKHLKESSLKILEVTGHCSHMSHPDLVAKEIQKFMPAPFLNFAAHG